MSAPSQQDMSLAKRLAHSSDKHIRAETAKTLSLWLRERKSPTEDDYLKLWKALFYTVWHSDKVPVQQELVLNLARLVRAVASDENRAFLFLSTFFSTMQREWMGIDKHRIDKYLSLLRRVLEEALRLSLPSAADVAGGTLGRAKRLGDLLHAAVMTRRPNGIRFHLCEVFLDEICAAAPDVTTPELLLVLEPFFAQARMTDDPALFERVTKDVLGGLLERVEAVHRAAGEGGADEEEDGEDGGDAEVEEGAETDSSEDEGGGSSGAAASSRGGGDGSSSHAATDLVVDVALLRAHQEQRRRNTARALRLVNLAPLACRIFAVASDKGTKPTHREALYALHARCVAAARLLGHATRDDELYPAGALVPMDGDAGKVAPAPAPAPAPAAGAKRQRDDKGAAAVPPRRLPAPLPTSDEDEEDDDEEDGDEEDVDDDEEDEAPPPAPVDRRGRDARAQQSSQPPRAQPQKQAARSAPVAPRAAPMIASELLSIPPVAALLKQQQQQPVVVPHAEAKPASGKVKGKDAARPAQRKSLK